MTKATEVKAFHKYRKLLWENIKGNVLEVGVGTGNNMPYYPDDAKITAIDFSPKMLEIARKKARSLNKDVKLFEMDIQKLDFSDKTFDSIVVSCVFCSVPDPVKGFKELKRVCKDDGKIYMLEHMKSNKPIIGTCMDILNPIVVRMHGANINRRTMENIEKAGLRVEYEENLFSDFVKYIILLPTKESNYELKV